MPRAAISVVVPEAENINPMVVEASVWSPARLRPRTAVGVEDAFIVWPNVARLVATFDETAALTDSAPPRSVTMHTERSAAKRVREASGREYIGGL